MTWRICSLLLISPFFISTAFAQTEPVTYEQLFAGAIFIFVCLLILYIYFAKPKRTEKDVGATALAAKEGNFDGDLPDAHLIERKQIVVKSYTGDQTTATALFQADAKRMAVDGYYPTSQTWVPGQYGCGAFLFALLLCFVLIGILVFIYMLIVKPPGTLTVTYEYRAVEKTCPRCAEKVKAAALMCHYCGYEFSPDDLKKLGK